MWHETARKLPNGPADTALVYRTWTDGQLGWDGGGRTVPLFKACPRLACGHGRQEARVEQLLVHPWASISVMYLPMTRRLTQAAERAAGTARELRLIQPLKRSCSRPVMAICLMRSSSCRRTRLGPIVILLVGVLGASPVAWSGSAKDVFQKVAPSVVVVLGLGEDGATVSQGSGVVVGRKEVVTNCHVVEKATGIAVRQASRHAGGPTWRMTASLLLQESKRDLCLLYVDELSKPPAAPAVRLGFAKKLSVGEEVYAVGAPNGLVLSLSRGIVSQLRGVFGKRRAPLVQTDAAISPGSSGGGLFNSRGELVGITTFKWKGENLNFALPVEWVRELTQLGQRKLTAEQRRSACLDVPDFDCVIELARNIDNSVSAWLEIVAVQLEVGDKRAARQHLDTLFATAKTMDKGGDRDQLLRNIAELQVQAGAFTDALATTRSIDSIHYRIRTWAWVGPEIAKAQLESGDKQAARRTKRIVRNVLAELLKEVQSQGIEPRILPGLLVLVAMGQLEAGDKQAARQTLTLAFKTFKATKSKWPWSNVINQAHSDGRPSWSLEKRGKLDRALKDIVPLLVDAGDIVVAYHTAQAVYDTQSGEFGSVLKSMARAAVEADITDLFEALRTDQFHGFVLFVWEVAVAQLEAGNIDALLKTARTAKDAGYGRWFFGPAGFLWGDLARSQVAAAEIVASFRTAKDMSRGWARDLDHALRDVVAAQVNLGDIAAALTTVEGIDAAGDRAVAYTHIAKAQAKSGDREVARKSFGAAFGAAQGIENRFNRVKALRDMLGAHVELGDVAGARKVAGHIVAEKVAGHIVAKNTEPFDSDVLSVWVSERVATAQAKSGDSELARETLASALETAQGMKDAPKRDAALMVIVQSQLEVGDLAGARNTSTSFRSDSPLVMALTSIAKAEAKSGDREMARETLAVALKTARGMKDVLERDAVLMTIVHSQLEVGDMAGARAASTSFRSDSLLVEALTSIALAEAKSGHKQAARQDFAAALERVQGMEDVSERDSILWVLTEAQGRAGDVVGALNSLFRIQNVEGYQVATIVTQAKPREIVLALEIAERLDKGPKRDEALSTIIRELLDAGHIAGAIKAAEYMDDGQLRHDALREIILAKVGMGDFTGALQTAQRMSDEPVSFFDRGRSHWVSWILQRFATRQAKFGEFADAMKTAMSIKDAYSRFSALLRVAVSLKRPPERFPTKGKGDVAASLELERSDRILIQRGLASFKINVGPVDGIFGPLTRKAIRSWQAKNGLEETGHLTREQAGALINAAEHQQRAGDERLLPLPKLFEEFCAENPRFRICAPICTPIGNCLP